MKAYKCTQSKYYKKRTFRFGTLWDYRNEELHGPSVGDRGEGTYKIELSEPFEVDQKLGNNLFSEQHFLSCYLKGDGDQDEHQREIRLCIELLDDSAEPVTLKGKRHGSFVECIQGIARN